MADEGIGHAYASAPVGVLRPYINRISHVNVNVRDLEKSVKFWQDTFPCRAVARTGGKRQAFPSLGIAAGEFEGCMLEDDSEYRNRGIHLVEWKDPKPVGTPYSQINSVGWYRVSAVSRDVRARYRAAEAAGAIPYAEPRSPSRKAGKDASRVTFAFPDVDGITLEWITNAPRLGARDESLYHAAAYCRDLRRSFAFYTQVVGLDLMLRTQPEEPKDAAELPAFGRGHTGPVFYEAVFLCHRADQRNPIDLLQPIEPAPGEGPYASPFNVGITRLAFEVDDIDAAYTALASSPAITEGMVAGPPEPWDLGELGTRRVVLFSDPDGLGLELIERPPYPWEADPNRAKFTPLR